VEISQVFLTIQEDELQLQISISSKLLFQPKKKEKK